MKRLLGLSFVVVVACSSKTAPPVEAPADPAQEVADREAPAAEKATWELDGHRLVLSQPIVFETGSANLRPEAEPALAAVQDYLAAKDYISMVRIEGHADDQGLSEARALSVARWLVGHGVACQRLLPVGFGSSKPMYGDERDTRIDVVNAALRGREIGGMPADGGGAVAGDPCS